MFWPEYNITKYIFLIIASLLNCFIAMRKTTKYYYNNMVSVDLCDSDYHKYIKMFPSIDFFLIN